MNSKLRSLLVALSTAATLALVPTAALADQADKDACADLEEGDDCTRGDGGPGVCIPDESDTTVLTCDDDSSGTSDDSSSGCTTAVSANLGAGSGPLLLALGALVAFARRRCSAA